MFAIRSYIAVVGLLIALLGSVASADFGLANVNLFALKYAGQNGASRTVTAANARGFSLVPVAGGALGQWTVTAPDGNDAWIYILLTVIDGTTTRWHIGVVHPQGLAASWRVESLEQHFPLAQTVAAVANEDIIRMAKAYGPMAYAAAQAHNEVARYPNFLQLQQVTATNDVDGLAASIVAEDTEGHRKEMGFVTTAAGSTRDLFVRHIPENLGRATTYIPRFGVLLRTAIPAGITGALAWYRAVQQQTPGSFLNRRQQKGVHPFMQNNRFTVFVGARQSAKPVENGRYDVTDAYIQNILNDFGGIHGDDGLILYHMGQEDGRGGNEWNWPDVATTILPGYKKMLDAAKARGFKNTAYFLPVWHNVNAPSYSPYLLKMDRSQNVVTNSSTVPGQTFGLMSWAAPGATELHNRIIVDKMMLDMGYDGVYMDALEASKFSHCPSHGHAAGHNEQLDGITRWLTSAQDRLARNGRRGLFSNETPTEVFDTDLSGIDLSAPGSSHLNLFRQVYTGQEWPTTHLILASHPVLYNLELARSLREGARPTIVWTEWDGVFPSSIKKSPAYKGFVDLLEQYSNNWDNGFDAVIDGLLMAQLERFETSQVQPVAALQSRPDAWQAAIPAVLHSVFKPADDADRRVIVLSRWTDPSSDLVGALSLPAGHALANTLETVKMSLSKRELGLEASGNYRVTVLDAETGVTKTLGVLPADAGKTLDLTLNVNPSSHLLVNVEAING